jgi:RhoGEF domain
LEEVSTSTSDLGRNLMALSTGSLGTRAERLSTATTNGGNSGGDIDDDSDTPLSVRSTRSDESLALARQSSLRNMDESADETTDEEQLLPRSLKPSFLVRADLVNVSKYGFTPASLGGGIACAGRSSSGGGDSKENHDDGDDDDDDDDDDDENKNGIENDGDKSPVKLQLTRHATAPVPGSASELADVADDVQRSTTAPSKVNAAPAVASQPVAQPETKRRAAASKKRRAVSAMAPVSRWNEFAPPEGSMATPDDGAEACDASAAATDVEAPELLKVSKYGFLPSSDDAGAEQKVVLSLGDSAAMADLEPLRRRAAEELLRSETEYADTLAVLVDKYLVPLRRIAGTGKEVLPVEAVYAIFYQLELIRGSNSLLLSKIEPMIARWTPSSGLGAAFAGYADMLHTYSLLVGHMPMALAALGEALRDNALFRRFCKRRKGDRLAAMLVWPTRRVSEYVDLLRRLRDVTHMRHADFAALGRALDELEAVAERHEHGRRLILSTMRMILLERQTQLNLLVDSPQCRYLMSAPVFMWDFRRQKARVRHIVVLSDRVLVAENVADPDSFVEIGNSPLFTWPPSSSSVVAAPTATAVASSAAAALSTSANSAGRSRASGAPSAKAALRSRSADDVSSKAADEIARLPAASPPSSSDASLSLLSAPPLSSSPPSSAAVAHSSGGLRSMATATTHELHESESPSAIESHAMQRFKCIESVPILSIVRVLDNHVLLRAALGAEAQPVFEAFATSPRPSWLRAGSAAVVASLRQSLVFESADAHALVQHINRAVDLATNRLLAQRDNVTVASTH